MIRQPNAEGELDLTITLAQGLAQHRLLMRGQPPSGAVARFALEAFGPKGNPMPTDPRIAPYIPIAQTTHALFYPRGPFASIILAQGIIESDWFRRPSGRNNYFGIKANAEQIANGDYTSVWTHETLHGIYQKIPQRFATYPSVSDCFIAHAHLLTTPWYHLCIAATTPQAYAHALWLSHYATGIPGHPYDRVLIDLMDSQDLYQYDLKGPPNVSV